MNSHNLTSIFCEIISEVQRVDQPMPGRPARLLLAEWEKAFQKEPIPDPTPSGMQFFPEDPAPEQNKVCGRGIRGPL